jgi:hypothetical protein
LWTFQRLLADGVLDQDGQFGAWTRALSTHSLSRLQHERHMNTWGNGATPDIEYKSFIKLSNSKIRYT